MEKIKNWDNVQASVERETLPKGGYVVQILGAEEKTFSTGKQLHISVDIIEGDYSSYFANTYRSQQAEDKKWKGILRQWEPKDDGTEQDEWTKSNFKAMTSAIEDSNSGYHWDWNEAGLKNKIVGCLFRSEEWEYDNKTGFATHAFKFIPADDIRQEKFKIPKDKFLSGHSEATNSSAANSSSEEITSDDDLPFN